MIGRKRNRRGAAMVVLVLTCLLVISALTRAMTVATIQSRRLVRTEHQMRQTELLLDAGVMRAAGQLKIDPGYVGESWQPHAATERFGAPRVEIRVSSESDDALARLIDVTATLGAGADAGQPSDFSLTRRSHSFRIQLSTSSSEE